jgi:hypothetical protein
MKITKRQLRRIIKEEKRKLLRESVTDMVDFEIMVEDAVETLAAQFADSMFTLMDEDPEMFAGPDEGDVRSTPEEWELQVQAAQQEMIERLTTEINRTMSQVEDQLHGGDFHAGNAPGGRFTR